MLLHCTWSPGLTPVLLPCLILPSNPPHPHILCLHHPSSSSRHLSGHQKAAEPRTPRCGWDVRVRSPRDPAEMVLALREAAQGCGCQVHLAGPFLLSCTHGAAGARVAFEAEVCQLPSGLGQSSGVRFKRLWGAPLAFRDIAAKVTKELELWGQEEVGQIDDKQDKVMGNGRRGWGRISPPPLPPWAPSYLMQLAMPRLLLRASASDATNPRCDRHGQTTIGGLSMTFDLGAVSDLQPLLKTCHNLHILWAHEVKQLFFMI